MSCRPVSQGPSQGRSTAANSDRHTIGLVKNIQHRYGFYCNHLGYNYETRTKDFSDRSKCACSKVRIWSETLIATGSAT